MTSFHISSSLSCTVCLYVYLSTYLLLQYHRQKLHINSSIHSSIHACIFYSLTSAGNRAPLLLLMTMPSFLSLLSDDLQTLFLSFWLDVRSLSNLDVAISCHRLRPCWMKLRQSLRSPAVDDWGHSLLSLMCLSRRGIRASRVQMKKDTSRVRLCKYCRLIQVISLLLC